MSRHPQLTWLDVNAWLLDLDNLRVLIDPWLLGDLVFSNLPWLIRGVRPAPVPIPGGVDLLLLSQGLEDHAHPETLATLDKSIPVVASINAAGVARSLGFTTVTALKPGQSHRVQDQLSIQALPGAPIGPFLTENAYLLTLLSNRLKIYYEPHGYPASTLKKMADVDVAITPMVSMKLPVVGALIRGGEGAFEVAQLTHPQVMLPTAEGGEITYKGALAHLLKQTGGADVLRQQLAAAHIDAQVLALQPMQAFVLDLSPRSESA